MDQPTTYDENAVIKAGLGELGFGVVPNHDGTLTISKTITQEEAREIVQALFGLYKGLQFEISPELRNVINKIK